MDARQRLDRGHDRRRYYRSFALGGGRFRLKQPAAILSTVSTGDNRMSGTTDKIKGRVKEAIGALTNDKRLKNEGKVDQASGAVKGGIEKVVDKVRGVASPK